MNDLTIAHNRAILEVDESEGGIVIRVKELVSNGQPLGDLIPGVPMQIASKAQIWLDQRAISRLYAFLRDVMPDTEGLNGCDY